MFQIVSPSLDIYLLGIGGYAYGSINGLSVCKQQYSKSYEQSLKFYGGVWGGKRSNYLHFCGTLGFHR